MDDRNEIRRLRQAVQELSVLNDIATAVSSTRDLEQVIELIVRECVKHIKVEQGAIMMLDQQEENDQFHTIIRETETDIDVVPYHFGVQLSGWMIKNQKPLLINNFQKDTRFSGASADGFPISSLLSVPLKTKGNVIGVLNVFNKKDVNGFTLDDQRLLSIIATQSAQIVENARLYDEELTLKIIEEELTFAQEIQKKLFPKSNPKVVGYDIAGRSLPAQEVGGDYYDFITIDKDKLAICLGDISGKGMPAALLMANLQATLRGQALFTSSASECMSRSNKLLYGSTDMQKFATLFYGILDINSHSFHFSNAGHDPPYLIKNIGETIRLTKGGTVLGFMENFNYGEDTIKLDSDDLIIIYSDGLTEAMNDKDEEFGEDRIQKLFNKYFDLTAKEIIQKVFYEVKQYSQGIKQSDDRTMVVLKRN